LNLRALKILSRKNHTGCCCVRQCSEPANQNPNGIPPQSPGLRGTSYLGTSFEIRHNPNGVASFLFPPVAHDIGHNRVAVEKNFSRFTQGGSPLATLG
jgi:hypothetical protein